MWLCVVLGITHEVRGLEHLPKAPSVILAKHQSAWKPWRCRISSRKTPIASSCSEGTARLPFFGWGLAALQSISIDRAAGRESLNQVVAQGPIASKRGFWIIIFPEGTRGAGRDAPLPGRGRHLSMQTGAHVVPVALNAGECWPRNAFIKHPGTSSSASVRRSIRPA